MVRAVENLPASESVQVFEVEPEAPVSLIGAAWLHRRACASTLDTTTLKRCRHTAQWLNRD